MTEKFVLKSMNPAWSKDPVLMKVLFLPNRLKDEAPAKWRRLFNTPAIHVHVNGRLCELNSPIAVYSFKYTCDTRYVASVAGFLPQSNKEHHPICISFVKMDTIDSSILDRKLRTKLSNSLKVVFRAFPDWSKPFQIRTRSSAEAICVHTSDLVRREIAGTKNWPCSNLSTGWLLNSISHPPHRINSWKSGHCQSPGQFLPKWSRWTGVGIVENNSFFTEYQSS